MRGVICKDDRGREVREDPRFRAFCAVPRTAAGSSARTTTFASATASRRIAVSAHEFAGCFTRERVRVWRALTWSARRTRTPPATEAREAVNEFTPELVAISADDALHVEERRVGSVGAR